MRDNRVLGLPPAEMPDRRVKAVWLSLDVDHSGHISAGEFGKFMRLGEHVLVLSMGIRTRIFDDANLSKFAMPWRVWNVKCGLGAY